MGGTSRRGILAALAVSPAMLPVPSPTQTNMADAPAYALFERWWAAYEYASDRGLTDEEGDRRDGVMGAIEDEIAASAPGIVKAAMLALMAARWPFSFLSSSPAEQMDTRDAKDEGAFAWNVMVALRPLLSGRLAIIVSDFIDNPDRPVSESLLIGAGHYRTEA